MNNNALSSEMLCLISQMIQKAGRKEVYYNLIAPPKSKHSPTPPNYFCFRAASAGERDPRRYFFTKWIKKGLQVQVS